MEFTAAGIVLQAELLLVERDIEKIKNYLPKLERCANFIETRRDPANNLFLAGPGGDLLAPSFGGWRKDDGTVENAYLTGLSITYITALSRLIELEKMVERYEQAEIYNIRLKTAKEGLKNMLTDDGYFIKSLDPNGTKHGVYGQEKHGYFELSPNQDAICFRVVDDEVAGKIYNKFVSIPELRPYDFIIQNYPSYDDLPIIPEEFKEYEGKHEGKSLFHYGTWVNGGHWATCEARMIMAYYRMEKYEDARRSMEKFLTFIEKFKMDAPLPCFGSEVWFKDREINIVYDCFGVSNAFLRGLFEYLYNAEGLQLIPHIPESITELEQLDPIHFGEKRVYIKTVGKGKITSVKINGEDWNDYDENSIFLSYDKTPVNAHIYIAFGETKIDTECMNIRKIELIENCPMAEWVFLKSKADCNYKSGKNEIIDFDKLYNRGIKLVALYEAILNEGMPDCYEIAHIKLAIDCVDMIYKRNKLLKEEKISLLNEEAQKAANKKYLNTAEAICSGIEKILTSYMVSVEPYRLRLYKLWDSIGI